MGCRHPQGERRVVMFIHEGREFAQLRHNLASSSGALFLLLSSVIIAEVNKMLRHL
jgi:hypothetical protein